MVLQPQSEHPERDRHHHSQEHFESRYKCIRALNLVGKVSSEVPQPCHVANSDLLHSSCTPC